MARVSKGGHQSSCSPPFETGASRPPQGEVLFDVPLVTHLLHSIGVALRPRSTMSKR